MSGSLTIQYINATILLFASWWVYAFCQNEMLLPFQCGCLLIFIFILRSGPGEKKKLFLDHLSLPLVMAVSFGAGLIWRCIFPGTTNTGSLFPLLTAAAQSATIISAVLIFLKPGSQENLFLLILLAWLTVSVSINVPFEGPMFFIIGFFCMIATAFVILQTMTKPKEKKNIFIYYRDFILFSALLILMTTGLTLTLSRSIALMDNTVMDFISDYILPRGYTNFLTLDPNLTLESPGDSALDKRPILEIEVPQKFFRLNFLYLKLQVFKDYDNGKWLESRRQELVTLPGDLTPGLPSGKMTMFTALQDIIPSVARTTAVKGKGAFQVSRDNIIYAADKQNYRAIQFSFYPKRPPVHLSDNEKEQFTALPRDIAPALRKIANSIAGAETDQRTVALLIKNYFIYNFQYTLNVNFNADNRGIIKMIRERRPAYCSYFATASALLLRARGIPARVVTGFLVTEMIDPRKNVYLVRVRNAHAWAEALWPETDRNTGEQKMTWHIIDATPGGGPAPQDAVAGAAQAMLERFLEKSWINLLRLRAYLATLDYVQLKKLCVIILIILLAAINLTRFFRRFYRSRRQLKSSLSPPPKELQAILAIYKRYENHLNKLFGIIRLSSETDGDVLARLARRQDVPPATLDNIKSFLQHYQAVRFGQKTGIDLEESIHKVEESKIG